MNRNLVMVTYIIRNNDTSLHEHRGIIIGVKEKITKHSMNIRTI